MSRHPPRPAGGGGLSGVTANSIVFGDPGGSGAGDWSSDLTWDDTAKTLLAANPANSAGQKATMKVQVAGSSADDALFQASVNGVTNWSWGIDNSDSDAFKIHASSSLPASAAFRLSVDGLVEFRRLEGTGLSGICNFATNTGTHASFLYNHTTALFGTRAAAGKGLNFDTDNVLRLTIDSVGNVVPGTAALATTAVNGFVYQQSCPGPPTGVPAATAAGRIARVYDSVNDEDYAYNAGWINVDG